MITVWKRPAAEEAAGPIEYVLAPHVSLVLAEDGSARLLDMGGRFFALPAVGAQMLQGALERGGAATVRELAQRYQVGVDRVQKDFEGLLRMLQRKGLVRPAGRRRADPVLWLAMIVVPCLHLIRLLSFGRARTVLALTLAKLALGCFGWARTVTVWHRCLRRSAPAGGAPPDEKTVRSLDQAVRGAAAGCLLPMACKERALACWALLRWAGAPATLVVGLELFPLTGHCWCEVGPWVLSDYKDNCDLYTPVISYA